MRSPPAAARLRALLAAALGLVLFVEVNYLACARHGALDWSRGAVFTLSERTEAVLGALDREVALTVLVSEGLEGVGLQRDELLRRLLERYTAASPRLQVRFLDPDREPAAFAETVRRRAFVLGRAGAGEGSLEQGVLVEAGERVAFRSLEELFPPVAEGDRSSSVPVAVEGQLTAAVLQVAATRRPVVCLTTGHGEWDLAGPEAEELLRAHLESEAYEVRTLDPVAEAETERCAALVVGGPGRAFLPHEAERLRERLEAGGRLLVLLDAPSEAQQEAAAGLGALLERAGIAASRAPVRETEASRMYEPGVSSLVVGAAGDAFERTRALAGQRVALLQAAGLRATGPASRAVPLVEAAGSQKVEDWDGPVALALAAELEAGGGRLVVFGGSTVLFLPFAARGDTANLALVLESVAWLVDRPAALPLPPVQAERVRLFLEPGTLEFLWWWLVAAMPAGAALAGFLVLRARRRGER
ncbi:MAG: GldG family protein [Deltaproteobacteria bacterium]|nr:GldG family protein [Deltaproteobacteria bacterium]